MVAERFRGNAFRWKGRGARSLRLRETSGGGEIRTLERLAASPVFKTGADDPELLDGRVVTADADTVLASCLAQAIAADPRLGLVVERWATLPESLRVVVLKLIGPAAPSASIQ